MNKYVNPKKYLDKMRNTYNNEIGIFWPWFPAMLNNPRLIKFLMPWHNTIKLRDARLPWLSFEAIEWLDRYLANNMTVFEWGSGGSTIYIAKKVKKIISVEHDPVWYAIILEKMKNNGIFNCEYMLKEPVESDFKEYCEAIDLFPDRFFDMVLVDGRARSSCVVHAQNKIKAGGCLVVDDSERANYQEALGALQDNWTRKDFFGPKPYTSRFEQTSIFIYEPKDIR